MNKKEESVIEYMESISKKCEEKMKVFKPLTKISEENIYIPTIENYDDITKYNYNVSQLKSFAKHYRLKVSGNKKELVNRLFGYFYLSSHIIKIQKVFKGVLCRKYNSLHGPAYIKRHLCTNSTDFITMEPIEEINSDQFISYKDKDDFIYGFDIVSLYNIISKTGKKEVLNPYNRSLIPDYVLKKIKSILKIAHILKIKINLQIEDDSINISGEKAIELRTLSLFQYINSLGNYSEPSWFLSLNRSQLIKFMRELIDIWNYRAQISNEIKRSICPPNGDPFTNLHMNFIHSETNSMNNVRKVILEVLEKLVNSASDSDNKSLGAYYILGALTLVNQNAASTLPWLYQSFCYY